MSKRIETIVKKRWGERAWFRKGVKLALLVVLARSVTPAIAAPMSSPVQPAHPHVGSASGAHPAKSKVFGKGHPFEVGELPPGKLKDKLQNLSPEAKTKAMAWLHRFTFSEFDAAEHVRSDKHGGIYFVCLDNNGNCEGVQKKKVDTLTQNIGTPSASAATETVKTNEEPGVAYASVSISSPPAYNSKPGASRHIYIDFNGAYVTGKSWSVVEGVTTNRTWDCNPWSSDGDITTFSDAEQTYMRQVWERIAEDYAPFDVNVTTDVTYDSATYTGDKNKVGWLLITPDTDKTGARCPHYSYGGVAYVGVFGDSSYFSSYQPAWVLPMTAANTAEAASHEMGHNMGLSHDGTSTAAYYGGHVGTASAPSWGPVMGTGYDRDVSQWSKGEYYNASLLQDDLTIISDRVPYRTDDHGGTFGSSTVWLNSTINQSGIIERTDDKDVFTFTTGAGTISFNAAPYRCVAQTWGGNLDVVMELYNSSQTLVASNNPASLVTASISYTATAGDYYLVIKPTGCGTPANASPSGYTVYGSLGQYTVTGSIIPPTSIVLTSPNGGENWSRGANATITWASGLGGNVKIELLKNGVLDTTIVAATPNDGSHVWAISSNQTIGTNYSIRITSVETPTATDVSFVDFSISASATSFYTATMDANPGWTLEGAWAFGKPTGTSGDPLTGFTGNNVIGFNLSGAYSNSLAETHATTPAINCTYRNNVLLSFYRWLGIEAGNFDKAYVRVSNDGINWTNVFAHATNVNPTSQPTTWSLQTYDISAVADGAATVYVRWTMGQTDSSVTYAGWNIDDVVIVGNETDGGYAVVSTPTGSSTSVTEGGATDTYTLHLTEAPVSDVTVTVTPNSQLSVSPMTLTFTTSNWATPQTVTVTAVNDSLHEFAHTGTITHNATSADASYNTISIDGILVNITDNDNTAPASSAGPDQTVFLSGGAWVPSELNLGLWLDASDSATITLNGSTVSQWSDKSGNNRHATQGTAANQPTNTLAGLNGKRVLTFDGSSDFFSVTLDFLAGVSHSAFIVTKPTTYSNIYGAATGYVGANSLHVGFKSATNYRMNFWSNDYEPAITANFVAGSANIMNYIWTSGASKQILANGKSEGVNASAGVIGTMSGGGRISNVVGQNYFGGTIAEIIIIPAVVTLADRQKTEGYLGHKWGLTNNLAADHPYKTRPPSNAIAVVTLDGTVNDADGDALTNTWTLVSGPGTVTFGNSNAVDTAATFTVAGTYTLRLTTRDPVASTSDDVVINVFQAGFTTMGAVPYVWLASWTNNFEIAVTNDWDKDGFTTVQEYWSGTDPMNSHSFFKIDTIINNGTNLVLKWQHASIALTNPIPPIFIAAKSNLVNSGWVYVAQVQPTNGVNMWTTTNMAKSFYRLCATNAP